MTRSSRTTRITDCSPHTSFVDRAGFKIMYVTVIISMWAFLHATHAVRNAGEAWNWILRSHAVFTYIFFHWIKGAPETGMLEDEKLQLMTFWEQIDGGYFGTPSRRFLTFVPFGVFFVTLVFNVQHDDVGTLLINAAFTLVCLVPKLESFFKVRLFGINKE